MNYLFQTVDEMSGEAEALYESENGLDMDKGVEQERETKKITLILESFDISFVANAPEDITLNQLLEQCNRIKTNYGTCGIRAIRYGDYCKELLVAIEIDYDSVKKVDDSVPCLIIEN